MTTRSRPATRARLKRLERLEQSGQPEHPYIGTDFLIDPASARAVVESHQHLRDLLRRTSPIGRFWGGAEPLPGEIEEAAARLGENLRGLRCPADYWLKQADIDRRWQAELGHEKWTLPEAERLQLEARLIVFGASSAGAAFRRMFVLALRQRNAAEDEEFDALNRRYPGMPLEIYDDLVVYCIRLSQDRPPRERMHHPDAELWSLVPR